MTQQYYAGLWQQDVAPTVAHYGMPAPSYEAISAELEEGGFRPRALVLVSGAK